MTLRSDNGISKGYTQEEMEKLEGWLKQQDIELLINFLLWEYDLKKLFGEMKGMEEYKNVL